MVTRIVAGVAAGFLLVASAAGQEGYRHIDSLASERVLRDCGAAFRYDMDLTHRPILSVRVFGNLNDDDFRRVSAFKYLEHLLVSGENVTDAGTAALKGLFRLRDVRLHCPKVGDGAVKHLATLPALDNLSLTYSGITDAGMKGLAGCPKLASLNLRNTAVTDAGLMALAASKSLKSVDVHDTKLTAAGVKAFQAALPGCKVER
ncbi:MAG: hypothetical protein U0804_18005 [Gemmataceae bacterium]